MPEPVAGRCHPDAADGLSEGAGAGADGIQAMRILTELNDRTGDLALQAGVGWCVVVRLSNRGHGAWTGACHVMVGASSDSDSGLARALADHRDLSLSFLDPP